MHRLIGTSLVLRVGVFGGCDGVGLLLQTFRQGWLLNVHKILLVSNNSNPQSQPYLFYAIKNSAEDLAPVKCFFGNSQNPCTESQVHIPSCSAIKIK